MPLVLGVDLGTQSLKAVLCDERLTVLAEHSVPVTTRYPQPGCAEQEPGDWIDALDQVIADVLTLHGVSRAGELSAIGIAGQLDGCVPVGDSGVALGRALIWQDRRAVAEARLADPARVHATTGQVADPSHMAPKIRWLREHGIHAARWHQPVSFLVEHLTGAAVLDPAHASTTMLYDIAAGRWSPALLAAFAIDPDELPAIAPAHSIAGHVRAGVSTRTVVRPLRAGMSSPSAISDLLTGTPVVVGTGDDFATPLGAGLAAPGSLACVLGTAEVVGAISAAPTLDTPAARAASDPWRALAEPMVETHAYPTGAYFIENPGWLSGGAVRWATRMLGLTSDAELDALAASAPPGADGLTFIPALAGAMTPTWRPEARGALHGRSAAHDRAHIARAVLEGLAFASRDVVERLVALGCDAPVVHLLGGGSRSTVWAQIRADVLQRPHDIAARTDTCALGAAMLAAVGAGIVPDLPTACALAQPPARRVHPRGSLDEHYERYRQLVR